MFLIRGAPLSEDRVIGASMSHTTLENRVANGRNTRPTDISTNECAQD